MNPNYLNFEQPIAELQAKIDELRYVGSDSFEQQIFVDAEAGSAPNVAVFPQPGLAADMARRGFLTPLADGTGDWVRENYAAGQSWVDLVTYGDADGIRLEEVVRELEDGGHRRVPVDSEEGVCDDAIKRLLASLDESSSTALGSGKLGDLVREVHGEFAVESHVGDPSRNRERHSRARLKRRRDE